MASTDLIVRLIGQTEGLRRDLAKANSSVEKFKRGVVAVGSALGVAFGARAIIQGMKYSIDRIAEFELQMDKVAAISGATGKEIEDLKNNALDLGKTTKYTASEIAGMQEVLARLGFTTDKIINSTDAIRKLATAAGEELAPSAETLAKTLNAFNLSANESERVANVMAESFSKSALNLEEFGVGMSYAATAGKTFGLTLEETTSLLSVLVDNGIQGSKAGTGLRDIFADLAIKGMTLQEAFDLVNKSADKTTTAFDLVGKTSMNQLIILAENQTKVQELTDTYSDLNHELDTMVATMEDNLATDLKLMESAFDGLVLQGGKLNPILRTMVQTLTAMAGGDVKGGFTDVSTLLGSELPDRIEKLNFALDQLKQKYDRGIYSTQEYKEKQEELNTALDDAKKRLDSLEGGAWPKQFEFAPPVIDKITESTKELTKQTQKYLDLLGKGLTTRTEDSFLFGNKKTEEGFLESQFGGQGQGVQGLQGLEGVQERMAKRREQLRIEALKIKTDLQMIDEDLNNTIVNGIAQSLGNAFMAIGEAIAMGVDPMAAAGKAILTTLAQIVGTLGDQMIGAGIGMLGIETALASGIGSGAGLIAAGAILKALAGAGMAAISGISSAGGGGGASASGVGSSRGVGSGVVGLGFENRSQAIDLTLNAVIEGDKLRFVLDKSDKNRGIRG